MRLAQREENFRGVKASRSGPQISHLLFVDDCILFGEATERRAGQLKRVLSEYRTCSEQQVNFDKSTFEHKKKDEKELITRTLGVRSSNDPERYLGLPNMVGRRKNEAFQILKDRFRQRINNWSIRHLSQGGKEVFIKAVLQAIPTYTMACFLLPKALCSELENIIARFWWQKNHGQRGIHWCTWKELCYSKELGGLGFRRLEQFNIALLAKQGWRLINYPDSLLAQAAKKLLNDGLCWRVGKGDRISVWNDCWIPGTVFNSIEQRGNNTEIESVSGLIDTTTRMWKRGLIETTFSEQIAQKILQIPLAEVEQDDFQVWRGEHSGEFTARSTYKILQEVTTDPNELLLQAESKKFYRKLWNLQLPSKIGITIWRFT
ncbi:reverse transcriptase [Gossypium australe]|uniref:Reverse transcriptase n=1 Tax=Gossypium australe TaxID=47621 RepID=A0A5B6VHZ5_9ROSI|nr:reverse transcriptase [Gossypium australe]